MSNEPKPNREVTQDQDLLKAQRELDVAAARATLIQRLRQVLTQDKMDAFHNDSELQDFIRQTEHHDIGLKGVIRQDEMERLKQRFQFERDREGILRRIEIEGITDDARRERAWKELLAEERQKDEQHRRDLDRQLDTDRNDLEVSKVKSEIERLEHAERMRQGEEVLLLLQKVGDTEHPEDIRAQVLEVRTLQERSKATVEALLSILDGPAADRILQLEDLRCRQRMSPEQLLALAAQASPEAAKALASKYEADGQISAKQVELLQQRLAEQRQTVVAGGGLGNPAVNPQPSLATACRQQTTGYILSAFALCKAGIRYDGKESLEFFKLGCTLINMPIGREHIPREEAEGFLSAFTSQYPDSRLAWFEYGVFLRDKVAAAPPGDKSTATAAMQCFERAKALAPEDPEIEMHMALLCQAMADFEGARRHYNSSDALSGTFSKRCHQ